MGFTSQWSDYQFFIDSCELFTIFLQGYFIGTGAICRSASEVTLKYMGTIDQHLIYPSASELTLKNIGEIYHY